MKKSGLREIACGARCLRATTDRGDNGCTARAGSLAPPLKGAQKRHDLRCAPIEPQLMPAQKARGKVFQIQDPHQHPISNVLLVLFNNEEVRIYAFSRTAPRKSGPVGAAQGECSGCYGEERFLLAVLAAWREIILGVR